MPTFQYSPLPDNSIRLLTVTGISSDGEIECELRTDELTEALQFYALSYVWGSDVKVHSICCNGSELGVTQNLYEALAALSPALIHDRLPIWIDAICIQGTI